MNNYSADVHLLWNFSFIFTCYGISVFLKPARNKVNISILLYLLLMASFFLNARLQVEGFCLHSLCRVYWSSVALEDVIWFLSDILDPWKNFPLQNFFVNGMDKPVASIKPNHKHLPVRCSNWKFCCLWTLCYVQRHRSQTLRIDLLRSKRTCSLKKEDSRASSAHSTSGYSSPDASKSLLPSTGVPWSVSDFFLPSF